MADSYYHGRARQQQAGYTIGRVFTARHNDGHNDDGNGHREPCQAQKDTNGRPLSLFACLHDHCAESATKTNCNYKNRSRPARACLN